jgi:hypothetical protein
MAEQYERMQKAAFWASGTDTADTGGHAPPPPPPPAPAAAATAAARIGDAGACESISMRGPATLSVREKNAVRVLWLGPSGGSQGHWS